MDVYTFRHMNDDTGRTWDHRRACRDNAPPGCAVMQCLQHQKTSKTWPLHRFCCEPRVILSWRFLPLTCCRSHDSCDCAHLKSLPWPGYMAPVAIEAVSWRYRAHDGMLSLPFVDSVGKSQTVSGYLRGRAEGRIGLPL